MIKRLYVVVKEDQMHRLPELGFTEGRVWWKYGSIKVRKDTREVAFDTWDRSDLYVPVLLFDMIQQGIVVTEE